MAKKRSVFGLLALGMIAGVAGVAKGDGVGFTFDVTTFYQFGAPGDLTAGPVGSPDTGFFRITNSGASTFTGNVKGNAVWGNGFTDQSFTFGVVLAPGNSATFSINDESSNVGGFNGPTGTTQNGVQIELAGTVALGANSEVVDLSVYDKDIHSGVVRSANGTNSDSYVLQGGDPLGGDTGDGFETTQAPGHFQFSELAAPGVAPLPGVASVGIVLLGGFGLRGRLRRRSNA